VFPHNGALAVRGGLLGRMVAVVCVTTALGAGVTPALAATTTASVTASSSPSPTVTTPSFGLGNAGADTTAVLTSTTPATTTTSTTGGGLSGGDAILIGAIVLGLLIAIAVFVMVDARRHTVDDPDVSDDPFASKRKGSKAPPKSRKLKPAERKRRKRSRAPRKRW
jgi:hypothetical protein